MQRFNIPRQSKVRQREARPVQRAVLIKRGAGAYEPRHESRSRLNAIQTAVLTACVIAGLVACSKPTVDQGFDYPETRVSEHTDLYHGEAVSDPYRWLEDDLSTETKDWIERQNDTTFGYLANIPYRDELKDRYAALIDYPTESAPFTEGDWQYFYQNSGSQNHSVLMRRQGNDEPVVFLDPNTFSDDATVSLAGIAFSENGQYAAYATSDAGSDWRTVHVIDTETLAPLNAPLQHVKFSGLSWQGDQGFYYSSYTPPEGSALSARVDQHLLFFHKVGDDQSKDRLIFGAGADEQRRYVSGRISEDGQFLAVEGAQTTAGNDLRVKSTVEAQDWVTVQSDLSADTRLVTTKDDYLFLFTNLNAPNGRLVKTTLDQPDSAQWADVIPESDAPLRVSTGAGYLFAHYMIDAQSRLYQYDLEGNRLREIPLPAPGSASLPRGKEDDKTLYYRFTNYATPSTIYALDPATGESSLHFRPSIAFNPDDYVSQQVFYTSKDGTRVPMMITHLKDRDPSRPTPTILYGYGGFDISLTPSFNSAVGLWLSLGGIYAVPNLRGGGEYGKDWHLAGTQQQKQNVFDDFIAAAEYLIQEGFTDSSKLAIRGRSNGGLLVGAVMTQRPDLMRVALPGVGVMDMLRYHQFTAGAGWAYDYGTADDSPEMFQYLKAYSPVHNLRPGTQYPATLVTTADHDDRVVPAHSFKFAAGLQAAQSGPLPTLIRIETGAGHGAGTSLSKRIEQTADEFAFTLHNLGVTELEAPRSE